MAETKKEADADEKAKRLEFLKSDVLDGLVQRLNVAYRENLRAGIERTARDALIEEYRSFLVGKTCLVADGAVSPAQGIADGEWLDRAQLAALGEGALLALRLRDDEQLDGLSKLQAHLEDLAASADALAAERAWTPLDLLEQFGIEMQEDVADLLLAAFPRGNLK